MEARKRANYFAGLRGRLFIFYGCAMSALGKWGQLCGVKRRQTLGYKTQAAVSSYCILLPAYVYVLVHKVGRNLWDDSAAAGLVCDVFLLEELVE